MSPIQNRRRQFVFASAILSSSVAWASTTQYRFVDLSNYGQYGTGQYIQGISPNGQYLTGFGVGPSGAEFGTAATSVATGALLNATNIAGGNVQGVVVNNNGLFAGTTNGAARYLGGGVPVYWTNTGNGTYSAAALPLPPGYDQTNTFSFGGEVKGISNTGLVVGALGASPQKGVVWNPANGTADIYSSVPTTGNQLNTLEGISPDGNWMVGDGNDANNATRTLGIVYNFTTDQWVSDIGGTSARTTLVRGVNNNGQVTGSTDAGAFVWSPSGGLKVIPLPSGGSSGTGRSINASGWVVGGDGSATVAASNGTYNSGAAFVYNGTSSYLLNDLAGAQAGNYMIDYATGISDDGTIVGSARAGVYGSGVVAFAMVPISGTTLQTWNNAGSGAWGTAGNWSDSTVPNGTKAAVTFGQAAKAATTVTLSSNETVNGITFDSPNSYTIAASGGAKLTLQSTTGDNAFVSISAGFHTISAPVVLGSATTLSVAGTYTLTFSGAVTGAGSLTAAGPGVVQLGGSNGYTGATFVTGGSLRAIDGAGLPAASQLTINGGAFETSGTFVRNFGTAAGQFSIPGGNSGLSAYGADLTVAVGGLASPTPLTWGTANLNPTSLTLDGAYADHAITWANPVNLGGATRTITVATNTATMTGVLSGDAASGLTKAGAGTLVLTATNTYGGATTVTGGAVRGIDGVNIPSAGNLVLNGGVLQTSGTFSRTLGTAGGQVQIPGGTSGFSAAGSPLTVNLGGAGATLAWGGATFSPAELVLNDGGATGNVTFVNPVNLGTVKTTPRGVYVGAGTATFSGTLSGRGVLVKDGAGTLVLGGPANSYAGAATVNAGTLKLSATTPMIPSVTVGSYGTFDPTAYQSPFSVDSTQVITVQSTTVYNYPANTSTVYAGKILGDYVGFGQVTVASHGLFTMANSFGGSLYMEVDTGPVWLTGANTYTNPTLVTAGGLLRGNVSPNSFLDLQGGVYEGSGTFTRNLGASGAGNVRLLTTGTSGFSAFGGAMTVAIGGTASPTPIVWGSSYFNPGDPVSSNGLMLNSTYADSPLTFVNPIDMGNASHLINVGANTAAMTGAITGTGSLTKFGAGTLVLNAPETFNGNLSISGGTLAIGANGSLANVSSVGVNTGTTLDVTAKAAGFSVPSGMTITVYNTQYGGNGALLGTYVGSGTIAYSGFSGVDTTITANIGGANNLRIAGPNVGGVFRINSSVSYTGNTTVVNGETLIANTSLRPVTGSLVVTGSGTYASNVVLAAKGVTGEFAAVSVTVSGVVQLQTSTRGAGGNAKVLVTAGLDLGNDGFGDFSGTLDLTNNDLLVRNGDASQIRQFITYARDGGYWDLPGLKSSTLAAGVGSAQYATLAVVSNNADGTHPIFSAFDGVPLGLKDVMVKYTYLGDADLSGLVDGNDLAAWIAGYYGHLPTPGWQDGDFDGNGTVDMADYNLMMTSLQNQTTSFAWNDGGGSAVPEPGTASLAVLGAATLGVSRRRRATRRA